MLSTISRNGISIRLPDERWQHIRDRHPEMLDQQDRILETVADPDMIQQGDSGEKLAIRSYTDTTLGSKFLVVAYREISPDDGFILTAYFTNRPSTQRTILWTR